MSVPSLQTLLFRRASYRLQGCASVFGSSLKSSGGYLAHRNIVCFNDLNHVSRRCASISNKRNSSEVTRRKSPVGSESFPWTKEIEEIACVEEGEFGYDEECESTRLKASYFDLVEDVFEQDNISPECCRKPSDEMKSSVQKKEPTIEKADLDSVSKTKQIDNTSEAILSHTKFGEGFSDFSELSSSIDFDTAQTMLEEYNAKLTLFQKRRQGEAAMHLYAEMLESSIIPNDWTYAIMLRVFCHSNQLVEAEKLFERLRPKLKFTHLPLGTRVERHLVVEVIGTMTVLCAKTEAYERAIELIQTYLVDQNLSPTVLNFSPLCWSVCLKGNISQVEEVFEKTKLYLGRNWIHPSILIPLLGFHVRRNDFELAKRVLQEFEYSDANLSMSHTYAMILLASSANNAMASLILRRLNDFHIAHQRKICQSTGKKFNASVVIGLGGIYKNIVTNLAIYHNFMKRLASTAAEVRGWIDKLRADDLVPNIVTYNILLGTITRNPERWKYRLIEDFLVELKGKNIRPSNVTYNILIRFYALVHDRSLVYRWIALFRQKIEDWKACDYDTIAFAYALVGPVEQLLSAVDEMRIRDLPLSPKTTNCILRVYLWWEKFYEFYVLFSYAIHHGVYPNQSILLKMIYLSSTASGKHDNTRRSTSLVSKKQHGQRIILEIHKVLTQCKPQYLSAISLEYWKCLLDSQKNSSIICGITYQSFKFVSDPSSKLVLARHFLHALNSKSVQHKQKIEFWQDKLSEEPQFSDIEAQFVSFIQDILVADRSNNPRKLSKSAS